jgi:hypothetical protein
MGTGGPLPGAKARPGRDSDPSPRSRMSRSYTPFPQVPSWHVVGLLYLYAFTVGCLMTEPSPIKVDQSLSYVGMQRGLSDFLFCCLAFYHFHVSSIPFLLSSLMSSQLASLRTESPAHHPHFHHILIWTGHVCLCFPQQFIFFF